MGMVTIFRLWSNELSGCKVGLAIGISRCSIPIHLDRFLLSAVADGNHDSQADGDEQPDADPERLDRGEDTGLPESQQYGREEQDIPEQIHAYPLHETPSDMRDGSDSRRPVRLASVCLTVDPRRDMNPQSDPTSTSSLARRVRLSPPASCGGVLLSSAGTR